MLALLANCGGHWLVLQSVAWTTMLVENARQGSFVQAVQVTFDGAHPCGMCVRIAEGRKNEKPQDAPLLVAKVELFYEPAAIVLRPPLASDELAAHVNTAAPRSSPPLLRPPRVA